MDGGDSAAFSGFFYTRTESCSWSFIYAHPTVACEDRWKITITSPARIASASPKGTESYIPPNEGRWVHSSVHSHPWCTRCDEGVYIRAGIETNLRNPNKNIEAPSERREFFVLCIIAAYQEPIQLIIDTPIAKMSQSLQNKKINFTTRRKST